MSKASGHLGYVFAVVLWLAAGVAVAATLCLSGCANLGYYWQSVEGHLSIMRAARPVVAATPGG